LQDLGLKNNLWTQAADIAMLYEPAFSLSIENPEKVRMLIEKLEDKKKSGKQVVAFSPSILVMEKSEKTGSAYTDIFLNLIKRYGYSNIHFVLVPNASREGTSKSRNNDLLAIEKIRDRSHAYLPDDLQAVIDWVDFDINCAGVRAIFDQADILLTSRFHAMVAGLALCTPTAVIGWSHKYQETLADFAMEEMSIDYSSPESNVETIFETLLERKSEYAERIKSHLPSVQRSSLVQFNYVKDFLSCMKN
jgi:polysaccharide pyruvyl transferase WcaK-like protein